MLNRAASLLFALVFLFLPLTDSAHAGEAPTFAEPVRLKANGKFVNEVEKMPFPSPVFLDIDGDKKKELVLGDLLGRIWIHERSDDGTWGKSRQLQVNGKPLKVPNW